MTAIEMVQQRKTAIETFRFGFAGQRFEGIKDSIVDEFGGTLEAGRCAGRAVVGGDDFRHPWTIFAVRSKHAQVGRREVFNDAHV